MCSGGECDWVKTTERESEVLTRDRHPHWLTAAKQFRCTDVEWVVDLSSNLNRLNGSTAQISYIEVECVVDMS